MITPNQITNYNRSEDELEEFLLFAILVAGKKAEMQAKKLDSFIGHAMMVVGISPFDWLQHLVDMEKDNPYYNAKSNPLMSCMVNHKLGQYKRLNSAFRGILKFKNRLSSVTIEQLESVKGIGSKTARFFILHSRPNQKIACLDTHILKWMAYLGYDAPKQTPTKKKYGEIERWFLMEAENRKMTPADLDLQVWKDYAETKKHHPELV
jgi:thermostable 8-oxoguanine DNA glycosylase